MAFAMAAGNRVLGGGEVARPCLVADRSLCSELVRAEAGQRGGDGAGDDGAGDDGADRTTMVPEMVPEKIAPSNLKALGLEISMAPAPAPRRRQVSAQRGSGLGVCRARRYAQRR